MRLRSVFTRMFWHNDCITEEAALICPSHLSITHEEDPKIPELHLRQDLFTNLERATDPLPIENHEVVFGSANSHPSCFTLGCKLPKYRLEVQVC